MVVLSILSHAEFGRNDHREEAPHFTILEHSLATTPSSLFERLVFQRLVRAVIEMGTDVGDSLEMSPRS